MILVITLSVLIGLLLGLLGGGGSILTVPVLVYVLHIAPKTAIVTSFVVVGISSLMALIPHARKGNVCWSSGVIFGLAGMLGAFGGGRLAAHFSNEVLMALFGLVTLVTGLAMWRSRGKRDYPATAQTSTCPLRAPFPKLIFDGFFVGALTGLVGVGGGFLIVPALTLGVGLSMPAAVGTSLLVVVMNAVAGLGGYTQHVAIDLPLTLQFSAGAIFGSLLGGWASGRIQPRILRRIFGLTVVAIAAYVLHQSISLELLSEIWAWMEIRGEFALGGVTMATLLAIFWIAVRIHQSDPAAPGSTPTSSSRT
jgi:uncharacterized membrane protein YfcA